MRTNILNSPNFSKKPRKPNKIKFIVIHYTGMQSKRASLKRLVSRNHKVSCHFVIDRSGNITKMVDTNRIAWHAGKSKWKNYVNLNENSIGIELVNKGHRLGYQIFTKPQINKLIKLCVSLKKKYKIKKTNILGHSDIAPLRKKDPGEKFPWRKLSTKGLGLWFVMNETFALEKRLNGSKIKHQFLTNLYALGYRYFGKKKNKLIIKSFQRRYRPKNINGLVDLECLRISSNLLKKSKI